MVDRTTEETQLIGREGDAGAGSPCLAWLEGGAPRRLLLKEVVTPVGAALLRVNHRGEATTMSVEPIGDSARISVDGERIESATLLEHGQEVQIGERLYRFLAGGGIGALLEDPLMRKAAIAECGGCLRAAVLADEVSLAFAIARREHSTASIIMFAIDDLDGVVRRCGEVNRRDMQERVLDVVRRVLRTTDHLFMVDENAFAMLIPNAPADSLYRLGNRMRENVETSPLETGDDPLHATISVVIAHGPQADESPSDLIDRSRRTLNFARENGANQVLV